MTTTRPHSFCWGFCLSFACLLVWFVPLEALFAGPMPSPLYEDEPQFLVAQVAPQLPKKLRSDYRAVFGGSLMSGPWAKKSAMEWDGLSPHPLISIDGPCIYFPISEQDLTDDVEANQPINGLRFISTIGWVSTANGNFPVSFLASSNGKETLFYFTGLLPAEFFAVTDSESDDELSNLRDLSPCSEGVAMLKACDAQLDGVLSVEVSQSSQTLRHMLSAMKAENDICQLNYENSVRGAAAIRKIALAAARATRDAALDAAVVALAVCMAAAHTALAGCILLAGGTTWWSLGLLTVAAAAVCASLFLSAEAACMALLVNDNNAAKNAYNIAVNAANAAYDAAVLTAENALRICLSQVNTERVAMACVHVPQLGPASTAALESHRACYTEVTSFNLGCFESTGVAGQLDHAFHQALDECGTGGE